MKQTAVEWLVNEILTEVEKYDDEGNMIEIDYWNRYVSCFSLLEYVNKAKEMEKQQIIDAVDGHPLFARPFDGIDYYDEVYKK